MRVRLPRILSRSPRASPCCFIRNLIASIGSGGGHSRCSVRISLVGGEIGFDFGRQLLERLDHRGWDGGCPRASPAVPEARDMRLQVSTDDQLAKRSSAARLALEYQVHQVREMAIEIRTVDHVFGRQQPNASAAREFACSRPSGIALALPIGSSGVHAEHIRDLSGLQPVTCEAQCGVRLHRAGSFRFRRRYCQEDCPARRSRCHRPK